MLEVKQLNSDNIEIVNSLAHQIWPHAFDTILTKDQMQYMLDWMYNVNTLKEQIQTGHLYYIIKENNVPKGFLGVEANFPDAGILRIHKLYVLTDRQGKGLGRALVNQAIDIAFDLDMHTLHLNVNRFNKAAEFYKYIGFEVIREEDIDIGKGYLMEDFIMELKLFPDKKAEL